MPRGADRELAALTCALAPLGGKAAAYVTGRDVDTTGLARAARKWSSGERLLVDVALALWRGTGPVDLGALVTTLDGPFWQAALDAVAARRGHGLHANASGGERP
jgi:hypothetical protein